MDESRGGGEVEDETSEGGEERIQQKEKPRREGHMLMDLKGSGRTVISGSEGANRK